ncbi:913_t:CDS:2 [Entrophospora sp. SA101]|nr:913_t:CDS:2 [Entrophospora sp. SA101]
MTVGNDEQGKRFDISLLKESKKENKIRKNLWSQKAVKLCENPKWLDIHPIPNDLNLEDNTNYILYNLRKWYNDSLGYFWIKLAKNLGFKIDNNLPSNKLKKA